MKKDEEDIIKNPFLGNNNDDEEVDENYYLMPLLQKYDNYEQKMDANKTLILINKSIYKDYTYYPYDLFRTNFDYYARHVGKFELGEIEYFLGIQPSTTFSRYYCDYTNDYSQLILYTKLERIIKKLISEDKFHAKKENKIITDTCSIVSPTDSHNLSFIGIDLAVSENSNISITVNTKYGHSLYVQETEVSNDN